MTRSGFIVPMVFTIVLGQFLTGCEPGEDGAAGQPVEVLRSVETLRVEVGHAASFIRATGVMAAERDAMLSSEVGGRVHARPAAVGEEVSKGQVLLALDPQPTEIALAQARAGLEMAEAASVHAARELRRIEELHRSGDVTEAQLEAGELAARSAEAQAASAGAAHRSAERARRESDVRAPWPGVVASILVDEGEAVGPGQPVARLVALQEPLVRVGLAARDVRWVSAGDSAWVTMDDEESVVGTVQHIAVAADPLSRTYSVEVSLTETRGLQALRIGLAVEVRFVRERHDAAVLVPASAVVSRRGESLMFVVRGGRAERRRVIQGERMGDRVHILEGIKEGDAVIVSGQQRVSHGEAVRERSAS